MLLTLIIGTCSIALTRNPARGTFKQDVLQSTSTKSTGCMPPPAVRGKAPSMRRTPATFRAFREPPFCLRVLSPLPLASRQLCLSLRQQLAGLNKLGGQGCSLRIIAIAASGRPPGLNEAAQPCGSWLEKKATGSAPASPGRSSSSRYPRLEVQHEMAAGRPAHFAGIKQLQGQQLASRRQWM